MKKLTCPRCAKVIEGYNNNHVNFLMGQHKQAHIRKDEKKASEDTLKQSEELSEVKDGDNNGTRTTK